MIRWAKWQRVTCSALLIVSSMLCAEEKKPSLPATTSTLLPCPLLPTASNPTLPAPTVKPTDYACMEQVSETEGSVEVRGKKIDYTARAGTLVLRDVHGAEKASLFYIAYTKRPEKSDTEASKETSKRPLTFCTNGGPGSSSVWLHMGLLGPMRVRLRDTEFTAPPYQLIENEFCLLDQTDLVFIDPVSTGFSRAATGEATNQFHGVREDVQWVAEFIRLYLTRNSRWLSPKFFIGESYGTTRAAALLYHLHKRGVIDFNGVCLLSMVLDFQNNQFDASNDLPYLLALPTYTATAWYHHRLPKDLQEDFAKALKESEEFALNGYALALLKGSNLTPSEEEILVKKLARLTGLSPLYIRQSHFRVEILHFAKELLRDQAQVVGRFDSRVKGISTDLTGEIMEFDPSRAAIFGAFTGGFNQYIRESLKWNSDLPYNILVNVRPWNFDDANNRYLSTSQDLQELMTQNPTIKVFVGSSYFDLATLYFGAQFTLQQMRLPSNIRSHITLENYEAGHMMYTHPASLKKLREDLVNFYTNTLKQTD